MTNTHEHTPMKNPFASKPARIAVIAVVMVGMTLLGSALTCSAITPHRQLGPREIKTFPLDISILEPLAGSNVTTYDSEKISERLQAIPGVERRRELSSFSGLGHLDFYTDWGDWGRGPSGDMGARISIMQDSYQVLLGVKDIAEVNNIRYEYIKISDDVEVVTTSIYWDRDPITGWYMDPIRGFAAVRIGDVVIDFWEDIRVGGTANVETHYIGVPSNRFLQQIVDVFCEAEFQSTDD